MSEAITIVLPVYGRSALLAQALASVLAQDDDGWQLLIADDHSPAETVAQLDGWQAGPAAGRAVQRRRSPRNRGLFANLNGALAEVTTPWVLLLCSDDLLQPGAIADVRRLRQAWPAAALMLSTFDSIAADGSPRPATSAEYHDRVSDRTTLLPPERSVPQLLRLGSLNGNLTGMAFTLDLWRQVGPFREDWRHAADWEWLARAAAAGPVLLNRTPIASVRTHDGQLSDANRRSGHELPEVAAVVAALRRHALLAAEPRRHRWAARLMQFQLWNLGKRLLAGDRWGVMRDLAAIQQAAGVAPTTLALLAWLPQRWRLYRAGGSARLTRVSPSTLSSS
jgi:glycosyltransferase involved in cell wall biosynthesis